MTKHTPIKLKTVNNVEKPSLELSKVKVKQTEQKPFLNTDKQEGMDYMENHASCLARPVWSCSRKSR